MDLDPDRGPAPSAFLRNHPSALAEAAFVSGAIASGIASRTMRACSSDELICILPLGVAINSAMKRRRLAEGQRRAAYVCAAISASRSRRDLHAPCS
jgi:hypothetical protein